MPQTKPQEPPLLGTAWVPCTRSTLNLAPSLRHPNRLLPAGDGAADCGLPMRGREPRGAAARAGGPVHGPRAPRLPPPAGVWGAGTGPGLSCAFGVACGLPRLQLSAAFPAQYARPPAAGAPTHPASPAVPPSPPAPAQRAKDDRRPVPWVLLENVEALLDRHAGEPPVMQVRSGCGNACEGTDSVLVPAGSCACGIGPSDAACCCPSPTGLLLPLHPLQYCAQKFIELGYQSWAYRVVNSAGELRSRLP